MHPLDNVIWKALTTRHSPFAMGFGSAQRFIAEVSPLSGFEQNNDDGYHSLAALAGNDTIAVFLDTPYEPRLRWESPGGAPLLQMVCQNGSASRHPPSSQHDLIELGLQDSPDMLELTKLTKPGPFGPRTHELGTYLGIRREGKLVAMAGERLKVPGYTEVSAVCTHPHHLGNGYAGVLMNEVMRRIRQRGETPFLHVRKDNARAIALYERLGFRTRVIQHYAILRRVLS
jgi:ribosomal protein S18 acetylase RimI-like enzyme